MRKKTRTITIAAFIVLGAAIAGTLYHSQGVIAFNSDPAKITGVHRKPEDTSDYAGDRLLRSEDHEEGHPESRLNDLVYRSGEQTIDAEADSKLTVNIPGDFFKAADELTVVLYDITEKREVTAENMQNKEKAVFTYRIEKEGVYSLYAVLDYKGKKEYRDLTEFTLMETSVGLPVKNNVLPLLLQEV